MEGRFWENLGKGGTWRENNVMSPIKLHYITLHCITLYFIKLHCITLHCIKLYCIKLYYITFHCIASPSITLQVIALHFIILQNIALKTNVAWSRLMRVNQTGSPRTLGSKCVWFGKPLPKASGLGNLTKVNLPPPSLPALKLKPKSKLKLQLKRKLKSNYN